LRRRTGVSGWLAREGPGAGFAAEMGFGGEGAGPGDVAMAGGVVGVGAFGEDPGFADERFPKGEKVGGDILLGAGESFFGDGELVHEGEAEVVFFGGEIDFKEAGAEGLGGLPADLAAESGLVAGGLEGREAAQEGVEDGFEEVPVFGAAGEEGAKPEDGAFGLVDVDGGEVALAGGGDVETEAQRIFEF